MAKKGGIRFGTVSPLFLRPIVGCRRSLASLALRDFATVSSDLVALPHPYALQRLRIAAPFDFMEMRRGGSVLASTSAHSFRTAR